LQSYRKGIMDISQNKLFRALSEQSKEFRFPIEPKNWFHKILQKSRLMPKQHVLHVSPIRYGVRGYCASYINSPSFDKYAKGNTVFKAASLFAEHESNNVIMFLACVLWNKEEIPPTWLIKAIRALDQQSIDEIISFAHESIDSQSFLNSIISMIGVSLQPEEIIAPENESLGDIK